MICISYAQNGKKCNSKMCIRFQNGENELLRFQNNKKVKWCHLTLKRQVVGVKVVYHLFQKDNKGLFRA